MKNLIEQLNRKLNIVKTQAVKVEDFVFVKDDKKQISMFSLSETITKKQRAQVYALYNFLNENKNLTQEELDDILKSKIFKFAFLRKLNKIIDNLPEELMTKGPTYVMWQYQQNTIMKKVAPQNDNIVMS